MKNKEFNLKNTTLTGKKSKRMQADFFLEPHFIPEALNPPLNGINNEEVLRVATRRELLEIIKRNQYNPKEPNHFMENFFKKYGSRYLGELDGLASKRITDFLLTFEKKTFKEGI